MTPDEPAGSVLLETLKLSRDGGVLFAEIAAPPMNLLGPELVRDLVSLILLAEEDDSLNVVVFKSADPDYFISHVDLGQISEYRAEAARLTGEESIASLFRHLSASRLVTIAQIEGRARGLAASSSWRATCASPHERPRSSDSSNPRSGRSRAAARPSTSRGSWAGRGHSR